LQSRQRRQPRLPSLAVQNRHLQLSTLLLKNQQKFPLSWLVRLLV